MKNEREAFPRRLVAFALLVLMVSACSSGPAPDPVERLHEEGRALSSSLMEAVSATNDSATGYAEPAFAARAIARAESSLASFQSAAGAVTDVSAAGIAADMTLAAGQVVDALKQGNVDRAEAIRTSEFIPLTSVLAGVRSTGVAQGAQTDTGAPRNSNQLVTIVATLALVGFVAFVALRFADRARESSAKDHADDRKAPSGISIEPGSVRAPGEEAEVARSAKARPMTVDLKDLLEKAVAQIKDSGWKVSVICPDIQISVDPLRLQRVVIGAIGAAFLRGAKHAGVVVDGTDDQVRISVGDDGAPVEGASTKEVMQQLAEKARQAFTGSGVTSSWHREDGVTMFSIAVSQGALERAAASAVTESHESA